VDPRTRKFALIAWTLLASALLLGRRWSDTELGWGGTGLGPVENEALMPCCSDRSCTRSGQDAARGC